MTWITRFKRRKHEATFLATLAEVDSFKTLIKQQPCPACGQAGKSLLLDTFVRNPRGWDAEVTCSNCLFRGVVNSEGFDFQQVSNKGKARE